MVPKEGLEPSRHHWRQILSLVRLPFRHFGTSGKRGQIQYSGFRKKSSFHSKKSFKKERGEMVSARPKVQTFTTPQKKRISRMMPRTIRYQPKSLKSCFFT